MTLLEMTEPINIDKSTKDSRDLIMPHQQNTVDALSEYFLLDKLPVDSKFCDKCGQKIDY